MTVSMYFIKYTFFFIGVAFFNPNKAGLFEGSFFWEEKSKNISRRTYLISI